MKNSKRFLSLALGVGLLMAGCGNTETTQETVSTAVLVDVEEAATGSLTLTNQFVGTISPQESVYIIPMAQGKVTETFFEVGDEVKEGDILFKIDDSGAKLQLQQAQLSYSSAKAQANMSTDSSNIQSDSQIAQAQAGYVAAQAGWKQASDAYDDLEDQYDKAKKALKQAKEAGADEATIAELTKAKNTLGDAKEKAKTGVNTAEAQMEAAETAYQNVLKAKDLADGEDAQKQKSNGLQLAKVGVDAAELSLSYYQVKTPISGKVISKSVEVNGMATSASPAYTIASQDTMTVTYNVSEAVRNTLSVDQKIEVERNGETYEGVITEIANSVGMGTGLFQVKALVKANGDQLPSGVSVKITSDTYKAENDIIIPYSAVYYESEGSYIYVAEDGKAVKKYVTVGIFDDEKIQIVDGVNVGDAIITSWSPRLMNGVEIEANKVEEAAK